MLRSYIIITLVLGCAVNALAHTFTLTVDTETFIYEPNYEVLLEKTNTRVQCSVDIQLGGNSGIVVKIYGLNAKLSESKMLPSDEDLNALFEKAANRFTKESTLELYLGEKLIINSPHFAGNNAYMTWGEMLEDVSSISDPEALVSMVGISLLAKLPFVMDVNTAQVGVGATHTLRYRLAHTEGVVSSDMRATELLCASNKSKQMLWVSRESRKLGRDGLVSWNTVVKYDEKSIIPAAVKEETIFRDSIGPRGPSRKIFVRKENIELTRQAEPDALQIEVK